jgi:hypothetical protein
MIMLTEVIGAQSNPYLDALDKIRTEEVTSSCFGAAQIGNHSRLTGEPDARLGSYTYPTRRGPSNGELEHVLTAARPATKTAIVIPATRKQTKTISRANA